MFARVESDERPSRRAAFRFAAIVTSLPANILLVDDEPRNLDALEIILQSPGYQLVRAGGAEEALLALLHGEFAVIVLDVQMPGMDGIEMANLVKQRERTQHVPIIFLTAFYQDERRMLESYNVGAVDYLTKPVNAHVLRSKVAVFVDLHRKTAALRNTNARLEQEILQRQTAERALREANEALEARVETRTAALRAARDAAERSGRAKDDFLAALSHELRTPLNPVLLLASEAAENSEFPEEARAQFLTISKNAELEARLIDDLLDLTRISHGKLALDLKSNDVHTILHDAIETVRAEIQLKNIDLRLELKAILQTVSSDFVRLQQVFWNLLRNAVKFTPSEGVITVSTRLDAMRGLVVIEVVDTGIGLTPGEIARIYDAFSQGDHVVADGPHRFGGLGLGLTISKSIVEQHRGQLIAYSAGPGTGATFTVELPLERSDVDGLESNTPVQRDDTTSSHENARPPGRVLLVEDHEPTRTTLEALLRRRNYDVTTAGSLTAARLLASRERFDLLISDIGLPDGSGFELMREMKEGQSIRGIALTGYGMEEDISRSRNAGFFVHLTKPVMIQALDKALSQLAN